MGKATIRPAVPAILLAGRPAARRWQQAAEELEAGLDRRTASGAVLPDATARQVNQLLMQVERAMTEGEGLKGRPFFKHVIYAPQPTYREEVHPALRGAARIGLRSRRGAFAPGARLPDRCRRGNNARIMTTH